MSIAYIITRAFALLFAQEPIISPLSLPLSLSLSLSLSFSYSLAICFDGN